MEHNEEEYQYSYVIKMGKTFCSHKLAFPSSHEISIDAITFCNKSEQVCINLQLMHGCMHEFRTFLHRIQLKRIKYIHKK